MHKKSIKPPCQIDPYATPAPQPAPNIVLAPNIGLAMGQVSPEQVVVPGYNEQPSDAHVISFADENNLCPICLTGTEIANFFCSSKYPHFMKHTAD